MDFNTWTHQCWPTSKNFYADTGCLAKSIWPIGMDSKRESKESVLLVCHDDDDENFSISLQSFLMHFCLHSYGMKYLNLSPIQKQ